MEIILLPLQLLAFNPIAIYIIALLISVMSFRTYKSKRYNIILALCSLVWWLFGSWEWYMLNWRSERGDMAIRVDLVLFGPICLLIGSVALFIIFRGRKK